MAVKEILAAIAGAAASDAFWIGPQEVTVTTTALGAAETATIQIYHTGDDTPQDLYRAGTLQELDATNNAVTVLGPGKFRVNKSVTAAPTSINLWT